MKGLVAVAVLCLSAFHTIVFGQAGVKAFLGRHAYVHLDGKFTNRSRIVALGFGVECP
jgi:hypothetical protein